MNSKQPDAADTEASFARTASLQLAGYAVAAVVLIGLLMGALQLLASSVGSSTDTAKAVDRENNSISIATRQEPPQLNTSLATDASSGLILNHVMEGLLRMDLNDRLVPAIAHDWELTETTATFWLRENARWSDGSLITAHDFIFAWRTALRPELASEYAFLLYPIKNARAINEGELPLTDLGVSAPHDFTLVVELERPTAYFDKMVTFQTYFPIKESFYNATEGRFGADAWELLYSGPYVMKTWVHGASILMERNPHYWDRENRAKLDSINIAYITDDPNARLNFFSDGRIAETYLVSENLHAGMENRWHLKRIQDGSLFFLEFNHRPGRLTDNWHLRRAVQLVLDMEELVYKITKLPGYIPGESLFPVWLQGVEDKFRIEHPAPELRLNLTEAKRHLELAKQELELDEFPPLVLLSGDTPVSTLHSEWVQASLKDALGLQIKIDKQIFKQRLAKMTAGEFDMVVAGWGPDYDDLMTFGDLFASWNLNNRGQYASEEMDRLIDVAQTSVDPTQRVEAFAGIQQLIFDDIPMLPMYERGMTYVVHPDLRDVKRRVVGPEIDFTYAFIADEE